MRPWLSSNICTELMDINTFITVFSGIAFIGYGFSIFFSGKMKKEFDRFKLQKYLSIVGILEILGGFGLLIGLYYAPLLIFSSLGLALLMLLGVITRIRIKDELKALIPAAFFLLLNTYIFIHNI